MKKSSGMREKRIGKRTVLVGIVFLEMCLVLFILSLLAVPLIGQVYAVVNSSNVTVATLLQVGNVFPELASITVTPSTVTLIPNSTSNATIYAIIRDYNGQDDIQNVSIVLFNTLTSTYGAGNDNNRHYSNASICAINTSYGDIYHVNVSCPVPLYYYAEPGTWNVTMVVYDNASMTDMNSTTFTVNSLLALGLPDTIDYGIVNATEVSPEKEVNVTNFGNTVMNLSLSGYAVSPGDNLSMNCSLGSVKNISINYEKYNLSASWAGPQTLNDFQANYTNLSSSTVVRRFNLPYRQDDTQAFLDDTNATYWRIYVPLGVAGSCRGNIVFGAVQSPGS